MLLPNCVDLIHCIEKTLETVIAPTLTGTGERSAAASIGHLLRHVALRIELEGEILHDELSLLRPLLGRFAVYLEKTPVGDGSAARLRAALGQTLAQIQPTGYRNVASLSAEVSELRERVCDSLQYILPRQERLDGAGNQLYSELQQYMAWEVQQEARMIDPAFEGFGPRR